MTIKEKTIQKEMKTIGGSSDPADFDNTIGIYNGKNPPLYPALEYMPGDPKDAIRVSGNVVTAKIRKPKQGQPIIFKLRTSGPVYKEYVYVEIYTLAGTYHNSYGRCAVLDVQTGVYATDVPKDSGGFAAFPCARSEISVWRLNFTNIGAHLYVDRIPCGTDDTKFYDHPACAPDTSCHTVLSGDDSCVDPDGTGVQHWESDLSQNDCDSWPPALDPCGYHLAEYFNSWDKSWTIGVATPQTREARHIANNVSGKSSTLIRYDSDIEHWRTEVDPEVQYCYTTDEEKKWTLTSVLGEMPPVVITGYTKLLCGAVYADAFETDVSVFSLFKYGGLAYFSEKTMLQVYIGEAWIDHTHKPCFFEGYSWLPGPCSPDIEELDKVILPFTVHANFDYMASTDGVDPRIRSRNSYLENAITTCREQYEAVMGHIDYSYNAWIVRSEV